MRYVPERKSMFDDMFDNFFTTTQWTGSNSLMRTDIHEKDNKYILDVDMPGYKKEDIKISLFNGNLTISAEHHENDEEKDEKGNIIRQERYLGSCSRSFYVGDTIKETDIQAAFKDGTLTLEIPTAQKKEEEEKKFIEIL